jgi:hypothetical protein
MKLIKSTIKKIKGDASFRSFYRKKNNKENSIIVYATKEKEKNLLIYAAINNLLIENKKLYQRALADKISDTSYEPSTLDAYNLPSTSCAFNKHLTS